MSDTILQSDEPQTAGCVVLSPIAQLLIHMLTPRGSTIELKENTVIVVLGASGDLAKKKTFPALFGLVRHWTPH